VGCSVLCGRQAIQRAIDTAEVVFLPKGHYRLSSTLVLRPNTKLIGVARTGGRNKSVISPHFILVNDDHLPRQARDKDQDDCETKRPVANAASVLMPMSNGLGSYTPQPLILVPESSGHTVIAYLTGALWCGNIFLAPF